MTAGLVARQPGRRFLVRLQRPNRTSRTCPCCVHISKDNRLTQAKFLCVVCGYENHADVVDAINVLERGYRLLICRPYRPSAASKLQSPLGKRQPVIGR
ncbi:MAG: zinc ribbon domain-containing protein [Burkholderiaceae bacterium]